MLQERYDRELTKIGSCRYYVCFIFYACQFGKNGLSCIKQEKYLKNVLVSVIEHRQVKAKKSNSEIS